jgi:hypothetical protein
VEPLPSTQPSAPCPSRFSKASGASKSASVTSAALALPREAEDTKTGFGDPTTMRAQSISNIYSGLHGEWNISSGYKSSTIGKGWVESKTTARQAGTGSFAVRVVNDLTHLSRSFFSGSFGDTREGSFQPE